jgi:cytochrome P450
MGVITDRRTAAERHDLGLVRTAPRSPAGPVEPSELAQLPSPPAIPWPGPMVALWFGQRHWSFVFHHRHKLGDVWTSRGGYVRGRPAVISHPDHARSLFTAAPELVPTLATESPLGPVLGPGSVLTANGPRHLRQRKLLLPPFHGEAIARFQQMIAQAAEKEISRWPVGRPFALAPRMQAITLDVIMSAIFGVDGQPREGTLEYGLRAAIRKLLWASTARGAKLGELMNLGHAEPVGLTRLMLQAPDRFVYAIIEKRRQEQALREPTDILSLIMRARTEEGETLSDRELRDELMTLVLAGHETTANQLAWTWERLIRTPQAYDALRDAVRSDNSADRYVDATITEAMRSRPVIPMAGRRVMVPWRLGQYGVPADTAIGISILLLHHREDIYPDPFSFRPERWLDHKPGTYEWIPFGGGTRRCLGASLAMAEQRAVIHAMARRLDFEADDPRPERPKQRNVTMIPARGARVVVRSRMP